MSAGVVPVRRVVAKEERRCDRVTVPAVEWTAPPPHRSGPTSPWWALGPRACSARSSRLARARGSRSCRAPPFPARPATGPRAGSRQRWRWTTLPSATRRTRWQRAVGRRGRAPCESCARTRQSGFGSSRRSAFASTPTAAGRSRSAWRAAIRPGASCTRAAQPPAGGSPASSPRMAATHERIDVLEDTTATALLVDGGRCLGVSAEREGGLLRIASRGTVLATGGAAALWSRTTNPRGSIGVGLALAHAGGRGTRGPRVRAVPSHGAGLRRPPRRVPRDRGRARRGRDPPRPPGRAVRRRAGAA